MTVETAEAEYNSICDGRRTVCKLSEKRPVRIERQNHLGQLLWFMPRTSTMH